jgi:hypothetical protein
MCNHRFVPAELRQNLCVIAWCDRCGSKTTFNGHQSGATGREYGSTPWAREEDEDGRTFMVHHRLFCCSGCNRGAVGEIANLRNETSDLVQKGAVLWSFEPSSIQTVILPRDAPFGIRREVEEAERCASASAFRAASAMLRSALEKTLSANGYDEPNLYKKIEAAASDGVITAARRQRAQDNVRALGNDVVHDEWRAVDEAEFETAYIYTQRVIEDFYENRDEVLKILADSGRLSGDTTA